MSNTIPIPIPDVPKGLAQDHDKFMIAVKELLETFNGLRDPEYAALLGQETDIATIRTRLDLPYLDTGLIPPPTAFTITVREWSHLLEWVNTTVDHLDGIEVWYHTVNSVTEATRLAICGRKTDSYERFGFDVTVDYYYWIRSVSYTGKYSTWVPTTLMGGYLVPRRESLYERIEGVINALKGADPDVYDAMTVYEIDDPVSYIGSDGNKRRYRRRNYDIGAATKAPTLTLYWERTGILMEGEIDGVNVVGIDGELVVDGSILARSIDTATLTVGDGTNGSITIENGSITVAALATSLTDEILNEKVLWNEIIGSGKPESDATKNMVYVQGTSPVNPANGALWVDTSRTPYRHYIRVSGAWQLAATDNTGWEHPTNVTKIHGGNIYTGSIVAASIAAGTITANKLAVTSLSSITANLGTITAGIAKSSDNRFQIDFNNRWLRVYDASSVLRVQLGYIP